MANCVDSDETAHYEPSTQDLHYLHMYLFWSAESVRGLDTLDGFFVIFSSPVRNYRKGYCTSLGSDYGCGGIYKNVSFTSKFLRPCIF